MKRPSLHAALSAQTPLQIAGTINAYCAMLARNAGFHALYVSGAGVANASFGLPDLGMTSLPEVCEDVRRIAGAVDLPILVDADTGFGESLMVQRTVRELWRAGAAGLHLEDQVATKRCGHRDGKQLVSVDQMVDRLHAAVDARPDDQMAIMARTDALAVEPRLAVIERIGRYVQAGANMIFLEAARELDDYRMAVEIAGVPVLANITEFGKTPLFTVDELQSAGVSMVLYPLTAFRAMNAAAVQAYQVLRTQGSQRSLLDKMQTREELYRVLDYHRYESSLDQPSDTKGST